MNTKAKLVIPNNIKKQDWVLIKDMSGTWLENEDFVWITGEMGDLRRVKIEYSDIEYLVHKSWLVKIEEKSPAEEYLSDRYLKFGVNNAGGIVLSEEIKRAHNAGQAHATETARKKLESTLNEIQKYAELITSKINQL